MRPPPLLGIIEAYLNLPMKIIENRLRTLSPLKKKNGSAYIALFSISYNCHNLYNFLVHSHFRNTFCRFSLQAKSKFISLICFHCKTVQMKIC